MPGNAVDTMFGGGLVSTTNVNATSSGNNTVVAANAGYRIVALGYKILAANTVTVAWESGGGTILDGPFTFAQNGGESAAVDEGGLFSSLSGESLVLNLGSGVQVGGRLKYALVRG